MNEQGSVMPLGYEKVDHLLGLEQYMKTTQINVSTVMIDRAKIPNFSFPEDKQLCEDARLWMNLMHQGYCFSGLNKILTLTRVHGNSLSHNKFKMAQNTLKRYLREKELPVYKRLYYFFNYAYHGFEKRLRPSQLHTDLVYERFYHQEKSRI